MFKEAEQSSLIIKGKHNNCMTSLIILLIGRVHTHWPIIILVLHNVTCYPSLITRSHTACGSATQEQVDWRIKLRVSWFHSQDVAAAEGLMEVGELASTGSHLHRWRVGAACRNKASASHHASISRGLLPWKLPCLQMFFCLCSWSWAWPGHRLCLVLVYCTCFHI